MSEEAKRMAARILAWGGWIFTFVYAYLRAIHVIPEQYSIFAVMAIGIAILAGLSLGRYKMQDTIIGALRAGYELSRQQRQDIHTRVDRVEEEAQAHHDTTMPTAHKED